MGHPMRHARPRVHRSPAGSWWVLPVTALGTGVATLAVAMVAGGISLRTAPPAALAARPGAAGHGTPAAAGALAVAPAGRAAAADRDAGAGAAAGAAKTAKAAKAASTANANCTLIVPVHPLTARGLATPYQLTATNPADGPCHESNPGQAAFVQGAIIDRATGKVSVYNPLVVDAGTSPAVTPTRPVLPPHAVAALWFGFNAAVLTLRDARSGRTLTGSQCVNGLGDGPSASPFGQLAYCNAKAFFQAAELAIHRHQLTVPSPGTGTDGLPCPTTRSFGLIDQDQSDNVTAQYLITGQGRLGQDTAANRGQLTGATVLSNGSDNGLLALTLDPALGCTPWLAPDLADGGAPVPALPLDELQAARYAGLSGDPVALVPLNDPMTVLGGAPSRAKTDAYRAGVDQPRLPAGESPARYCRDMEQIQGRRLQQDVNLLTGRPSPVPAMASNLFTFLATRLQQSFVNLGCRNFGLANDVTLTANGGGMTVAACFRDQAGPLTPGPGNPAAGRPACPASTAAAPPTKSPSASPSPASPDPAQSAASTPSPDRTRTPSPDRTSTPSPDRSKTPAETPSPAQTAPSPAQSAPSPGQG